MTNDTDLQHLLSGLADDAPDASTLPIVGLTARIERRRRRQLGIAGAGAAAVAIIIVGSLYFGGRLSGPDSAGVPADQPSSQGSLSGEGRLLIGQCGEKVVGDVGDSPQFTMTADIPATVIPDARGMVRFDVTVTNRMERPIRGLTAESPQTYVTGDRVVLSDPPGVRSVGIILDLAPGESATFRAAANFTRCGTADKAGRSTQRLDAGTYAIYAQLQVQATDEAHSPTGEPFDVYGGPWTTSVR